MTGIFSTLATIWRLAIPYFRSEDRRAGRILLAAVVAIELALVGINLLFNFWNERFYNALQDRNWDAFVRELGIFCALAAVFIVFAVYQLYLNQWLQIRWRRWMTASYLDNWLTGVPTTIACSFLAMPPTIRTSASPKTSDVHRTDADNRRRPAQRGNDARDLHLPLVGAVRSAARWNCSAAMSHSGLSGLGRADLCDRRHRLRPIGLDGR